MNCLVSLCVWCCIMCKIIAVYNWISRTDFTNKLRITLQHTRSHTARTSTLSVHSVRARGRRWWKTRGCTRPPPGARTPPSIPARAAASADACCWQGAWTPTMLGLALPSLPLLPTRAGPCGCHTWMSKPLKFGLFSARTCIRAYTVVVRRAIA